MRKDLTVKELLVMGGGLFSMHFGAGCLLYPVTWGADAGTSVWLAPQHERVLHHWFAEVDFRIERIPQSLHRVQNLESSR